jgi:integration host factor subunit beta
MIKTKLVQRIAEQNPHLFAKDVKKGVNAILDEIEAALVRHDRVEIRGFGTFTVKIWSARPLGRNPKTGAPISIPEKHHPSFRTGKEITTRSTLVANCRIREATDIPAEARGPHSARLTLNRHLRRDPCRYDVVETIRAEAAFLNHHSPKKCDLAYCHPFNQREMPNSFSMSAIIGLVKPALRNSAKSSAMACSHNFLSAWETGSPLWAR